MNLRHYRASVSLGLLGALACSSPEGTARNRGGAGSGPVIVGAGGSVGMVGSGGNVAIPIGGNGVGSISGDFVVPEDDPTNPNLTHPKCGKNTCTDFPEMPILGDGVPANAPTLFGEPSNMTAGAICVLEPQLSTGSTAGGMLPANWVRPRVKFSAAGLDLFEIRIKNLAQKYELVAYTKKTTWYVPKDIWAGPGGAGTIAAGNGAANNGAGAPFTVTVRGVNSASPGVPVGVSGDFHVAPVVATGSMVFWTVNSAQVTKDSSKLLGFAVGDEGVAQSLALPNVTWARQIGEDGAVLRGKYDDPKLPDFVDGQVRCIGCHSSTPDGESVVFTDDWPWNKSASMVTAGNIGQVPTYISAGARVLLKQPWLGTQTMSKAHWKAGDRILITTYGMYTTAKKMRDKPFFALNYDSTPEERIKSHQLAWFDLETTAAIDDTTIDYGDPQTKLNAAVTAAKGTGWNIIPTGDDVTTVSAVSPNMSHDGLNIVYTATDYSPDGHPDYTSTKADLKIVPYNNKAGGTAAGVLGASDPAFLEYYPSYSADDKFIAFTRAPTPNGTSAPDGPYYNRHGEVMIIPAAGGVATRLAANDPVACAGDVVSQGLINSWPKWSPEAVSAHGKTYYFLIFSSARKYGDEFSQQFQLPTSTLSSFKGVPSSSQLYLAAVVVDNMTGMVTTYPAQYIWNQNRLATAAGGDGMATKFSNLTPAWDPFVLPPIVINEVPEDVPR